jgi:hypothetical protein
MVYSSGVDIMAKAKNKFTIPFTDKDRFTEGHDEHPTSTGWGPSCTGLPHFTAEFCWNKMALAHWISPLRTVKSDFN